MIEPNLAAQISAGLSPFQALLSLLVGIFLYFVCYIKVPES